MADYPAPSPFHVEPDLASRLAAVKEAVWFRIGVLQSTMNDRERALNAFERVLAVNPGNIRAMTQVGAVLAKKECYSQAVTYLQRAIAEDDSCGEAWAVIAHCYVMTDELQKAYHAYQSALTHLPNPRDPNLWYGIGLLYDRYGSLDNALEAFLAVLSISPDFERADEVCFCIGIIYKEQQNFDEALRYFKKVVIAANPPPPLTRADGWYQIGHVNELKRDIPGALDMYQHALRESPDHAKTLQNFGWLEHQHSSNSPEAIRLLKRSAEIDANDGQTWYLLGRVYMALREFRQAYDAYQQAVYRDGGNATFWCSIGVLYYQMNQYRDAMDAYSRAIRLNPYVSEVWYDLGTLYESCGQNVDAIDAYRRAAELAPENTQITARLGVLENSMNPASHPQQATSQPQLSASQPLSHSQPQQMATDLHTTNQTHGQSQLNPVMGRTMGPALHQLPHSSAQDNKLPPTHPSLEPSQLHSLQQLPPPQSAIGQLHGVQSTAALPMPSRSGHMGIPSLKHSSMPSMETRPVQNGGFSQDRPTLPSPLSAMQHPSAQAPAARNTLSSMMSQPLPSPGASQALQSQPHSSMLAPPTLGSRRQEQFSLPRSTSLEHHQLQPLSTADTHEQQQRVQHPQIPPIEPHQRGRHSPARLVQSSPGDGQQHARRETMEAVPTRPSHVPRHTSPQAHGQDQLRSPSQPKHQLPSVSAEQNPSRSQNTLPQIQSLPQLQPLPHMQQTAEPEKQTEQKHSLGTNDPRNTNSEPEHPAERAPLPAPGGLPRIGFEGGERNSGPRLPALHKSDEPDENSQLAKSAGLGAQPMYSAGLRITKPLDQGLAIRDVTGGSPVAVPSPPRSMSMREITQAEPSDAERHTKNGRRPDVDSSDRARQEQTVPEDNQAKDETPSADRLPALRPLTGGPAAKNSDLDPRDEPKMLQSLPAPTPPTLSLPPGNPLPRLAHSENEKPAPASLHSGPSVSGSTSSLGPSLPPLSTRNSGAFAPDAKEGQTGQLTHGASSLTKFGKGIGRTPVTPVNNSVAPASLPSPLPTRKNSGSSAQLHGPRSPRIAKPASGLPFKSVPMAPATSSFAGPVESVPSPSSLPVLPALSTRQSQDDPDRDKTPQENPEKEENHEDESRAKQKGPKATDADASDPDATGRRSDEGLANRPIFGMLRSAPAPLSTSDRVQPDKDDSLRSPSNNAASRAFSENIHPTKREGSTKEDLGRTAKRPRLQDINEKDSPCRSLGFGNGDKSMKGITVEREPAGNAADAARQNSMPSGKPEIPSFKEMNIEMHGSGSPPASDGERSHGRDANKRNGDMDSQKGPNIIPQDSDIPRLSNSVPKLSSPLPLSGNTPLPSFRSERKNISAARATSVGPVKPAGAESRGGLPFLRSAPVSSMPPPLKSVVVASGKGGGDRTEYESDGRGGNSAGEENLELGEAEKNEAREKEVGEHVANGENQKSGGPVGDHDGRRIIERSAQEETAASRTEVRSTAT